MSNNGTHDTALRMDEELAALEREKEALSQQVKRLIKAEGRLYSVQEELDAQLKEYKELYELNKKLNATTDVESIYRATVEYVVQQLEYERALFFRSFEPSECYALCAVEGFYDPREREEVSRLTLDRDAPLLRPLSTGQHYLICAGECENEMAAYRPRLGLHEFLIYPLGPLGNPIALLVVGNSAERAEFHRKVSDGDHALLSMGNLVGLISPSLENHLYYTRMEKALEQEKLAQARYRSIFENSVEGIYQRTPEGRYLDANPSLARMLGYDTPHQLMAAVTDIGRQLYRDPQRQEAIMLLLQENDVVEAFEAQQVRKDGSVIWVSMSARAIRDANGRITYIEGTSANITERKQAEEALMESEQRYRLLSQNLEQRVKQAVAELRQKDKILVIQTRQALMGEMISNIAHQWRQPLNMLGLLTQELPVTYRMGDFDFAYLEGVVKKAMEIIFHMSKTIDDFRNFFKSDREKEEFKALESITKTVSLMEGTLKAHEIRVEIASEDDPVILGYPNELSQVIINLLNNARDAFSKRNTPSPTIWIRLASKKGKTVVTVTDNAGGISDEIIDQIFEPYFTTKGPEQGTGIGLFMSKTIIEKNMNGTLSVRNVPEGAQFTIEI